MSRNPLRAQEGDIGGRFEALGNRRRRGSSGQVEVEPAPQVGRAEKRARRARGGAVAGVNQEMASAGDLRLVRRRWYRTPAP